MSARDLIDARAELLEGLDAGIHCPCCGQWAKRYRRKLNQLQARWLMWLVGIAGEEDRRWVEIHDAAMVASRRAFGLADGPTGGEYAKLAYWQLIEQASNDDDSKRTSATWRPTILGRDFARRRLSVPSHGYIFDGRIEGWADDLISIDDALGVEFDYAEIMAAAGMPPDDWISSGCDACHVPGWLPWAPPPPEVDDDGQLALC